MSYVILIEDSLSLLLLFFGTVLVLYRYFKSHKQSHFLLAFALFILAASSALNILEYVMDNNEIGQFEELISVLFIPLLIFSIHVNYIDKELVKREKSERKFKAIFNQSFTLLGLLSPTGKVLDVNNTAKKFVGYSDVCEPGSEFSKTRWWVHSEYEMSKLTDAIKRAQKGEMVRFETTHTDKNHQIHHIDFTLKPLYDDDGVLLYLIPEGRDITEIKNVRLELEKHKKNLEDMVVARTRELNNAHQKILVINENLHRKNIALESVNKELEQRQKQLKKTLDQLKETQVSLIEAEKMASIGVLTAGIAHEINNPINFISSNLNGLQKTLSRLYHLLETYETLIDKHQNQSLAAELIQINNENGFNQYQSDIELLINNIQVGVKRTVEIMNSLRCFLHRDKELMEEVDVHEMIKAVLTILHHEYKDRIAIEQHFMLKKNLICIVGKMNQVLMNVLSNAIDAIVDKGKIVITTKEESDTAVITIANDGPQIPKDIMAKIYDPFFTTKALGKGTGLGLYLSYKIVQEHNGSIGVESTPEQTIFEIRIPLNN